MLRVAPFISILLVAYLMYDCDQYRREPFWYPVLLIPIYDALLCIWRFKWYGSWLTFLPPLLCPCRIPDVCVWQTTDAQLNGKF